MIYGGETWGRDVLELREECCITLPSSMFHFSRAQMSGLPWKPDDISTLPDVPNERNSFISKSHYHGNGQGTNTHFKRVAYRRPTDNFQMQYRWNQEQLIQYFDILFPCPNPPINCQCLFNCDNQKCERTNLSKSPKVKSPKRAFPGTLGKFEWSFPPR